MLVRLISVAVRQSNRQFQEKKEVDHLLHYALAVQLSSCPPQSQDFTPIEERYSLLAELSSGKKGVGEVFLRLTEGGFPPLTDTNLEKIRFLSVPNQMPQIETNLQRPTQNTQKSQNSER